MGLLRWAFGRLRYHVGRQQLVGAIAYMLPNIYYSLPRKSALLGEYPTRSAIGQVALCLRFRDEARFLEEWIEYYLAAGVDHFFLYNNFSVDNYEQVLEPYIKGGCVTLIDWPRKPASPAAEHDCIERTRGRFEWVGFIDADEFVVVRDARSIPEFLSEFGDVPAVALHWFYYGSNGHERRPCEWVIRSYKRRAAQPNQHFKVFVRPDQVTRNRNSHNFYYRRARCAVREDGRRVYGSMARPPSAQQAWINHYYCKSLEDYLEKASRQSTLDQSGMKYASRIRARAGAVAAANNEVVDSSAADYFEVRRRPNGKSMLPQSSP